MNDSSFFCHLISVFAENNDQVYVLLHRLLNLTKKNLQLNGNYEVSYATKKEKAFFTSWSPKKLSFILIKKDSKINMRIIALAFTTYNKRKHGTTVDVYGVV